MKELSQTPNAIRLREAAAAKRAALQEKPVPKAVEAPTPAAEIPKVVSAPFATAAQTEAAQRRVVLSPKNTRIVVAAPSTATFIHILSPFYGNHRDTNPAIRAALQQ